MPKKDSGPVKVDASTGKCPWCSYSNEDASVGPEHEAEDGRIVVTAEGTGFQCATCGKNWKKEDLGKPWSIELERGAAWVREHRARQLSGG